MDCDQFEKSADARSVGVCNMAIKPEEKMRFEFPEMKAFGKASDYFSKDPENADKYVVYLHTQKQNSKNYKDAVKGYVYLKRNQYVRDVIEYLIHKECGFIDILQNTGEEKLCCCFRDKLMKMASRYIWFDKEEIMQYIVLD